MPSSPNARPPHCDIHIEHSCSEEAPSAFLTHNIPSQAKVPVHPRASLPCMPTMPRTCIRAMPCKDGATAHPISGTGCMQQLSTKVKLPRCKQ
jgi:hypothetical protein